MTAQSLSVDLRSLTEFAEELAAQLAGMAHPLRQLESLTELELRLGEFGEAHALGQRHGDTVADLLALVTQAREAVSFAEQVTRSVGTAYESYDSGVAGTIQAVAGGATAIVSAVDDVVDTVVDGVAGLITGDGRT